MDLILKSIESKSDALKFFIQYEAIFNESISESYKKFRKRMGRRAMKRKEFEYWYTRFSNGNMDLEDDRMPDRKPSTISKLATELKEQVVNKLESVGRNITRRLPRSIQTRFNWQELDIDLDGGKDKSITFNIHSEDSMYLAYGDIIVQYYLSDDGRDTVVSMGKNGPPDKKWFEIKGAYPLIVAFSHLNLLTKDPENPLSWLFLIYHEDEEVFSKIQKITDKYISKFNVKKFTCNQWEKGLFSSKQQEAAKDLPEFGDIFPFMLQIFKPVILETIDWSRAEKDELGLTATTEQFLNAKMIKASSILPEELHHFYRFTEFYIFMDAVPKKLLFDLKNALEKSETFKQCKLYSKNIASTEVVEEIFGPSYTQKGIVARKELVSDNYFEKKSVYDHIDFIKIKRVH